MRWPLALATAGLAFSVATGCATAPPCADRYVPIGTPRPFLWEVTGPHGRIVLYGTLHSAGEDDVPEAAWRELDAAEIFVAEADEVGRYDRYAAGSWRDAFEQPHGRSLMRELPASDFDDLVHRLDMDRGDVARLKPWVVIGLLMKTVFAFPDPNISAALLARARERGIATDFLGTWPEQVAFLDATVDAGDVAGALHDYPNIGCMLIGQIEAYRWGDDDAFRVDAPPPTDPGPARVATWSARIMGYLATGRRAFVAVGVGNILGADGLAGVLAARGFTLTRFPGPAAAPGQTPAY